MLRIERSYRLHLLVIVVLTASVFLTSYSPAKAAETSQFFPETGKTVSGKFLQYWQANGGLSTYGYPITEAQNEVDPETGKTFLTQWFQRNRFELHPENAGIQGGKYEVLLGLLGKDLRREALTVDPDFVQADPLTSPAVPASAQVFFKETGHNLRLGFLDYWTKNGGLDRFGYPISEEHPEVDPETGNTYISQWFERARFEYHPENAKPYDILLGLLGNQIKTPKGSIDYAWKLGRSYNELNQPFRIATDNKGNVYVADRNQRISKYSNTGQFLMRLGKQGSRSEDFNSIQGLAVDNAGNIYVAGNSNTIKKFDSTGNFLTQWAMTDSGTASAVTVDGAGNVYVFNNSYNDFNIQKFDSNGKFITKWGSKGSGDGQFDNLFGSAYIGSDSKGNIYTIDNLYTQDRMARIQKFDSNGKFVSKWTYKQTNSSISGFTVDADGNSFILNFDSVLKFNNDGQPLTTYSGSSADEARMNNARGVAADAQGNVYIADTLNDRVLKYSGDGQYKFWGNRNNSQSPGKFIFPSSSIVDNQGNLQVLDNFNRRVEKFDKQGNYLTSWGNDNKFDSPRSIALNPQGNIEMVDYHYQASQDSTFRILTFDSNGTPLNQLNFKQGEGEGQFSNASNINGFAVDKMGNRFLLDQNYATRVVRIQKFDMTGKFVRQWGSNGSGDAQFMYPQGLAVDSQNNVYVSDNGNGWIKKFDNDGTFLTKWNGGNSSNGFFPSAIASDNQDNIYVFNGNGGKIYKFGQTGQVLLSWGGFGSADGQFNYASSIALDAQHNIYVTDGGLSRVQKFRQR